jgi:hypothetical protein
MKREILGINATISKISRKWIERQGRKYEENNASLSLLQMRSHC